jgi:hypothetical protein
MSICVAWNTAADLVGQNAVADGKLGPGAPGAHVIGCDLSFPVREIQVSSVCFPVEGIREIDLRFKVLHVQQGAWPRYPRIL